MKFVFFLLAIALVSGVQSASVQTEVQEVQSKVQHRVQSVIDDVKKVFEAAREKAKKLRDELVVKSKEFFSKAEAQAREQYSKIEASFSDLWKRAGKINISQCKQVGQVFLDFGKGLFGTTKTCVDRTIDMGKSYMETLEELKKKIPASMSEFSNQAHACFDNKSERSDSKSIIECLKQLGSDWSERAADTATVVTQTVAKLGALVSEVVSDEMPKCVITDGMNFWKENSKTVHAEIKDCVDRTIQEWNKGK